MNKKLIVLMLLLPLLLMLSIFTSTKTVSLNVQVAVNKIEISGENLVYLDLEKDEKYFVSYAIYPVVATNKKVLFTTEAVNGEQLAELEFKDGYIIFESTYESILLLNGLKDCPTDLFEISNNKVFLRCKKKSVSDK